MRYKWKPSKAKIHEFKNKMDEIEIFCSTNGISSTSSNDSYYFSINEQAYRVSNHSVESSFKNSGGMYHKDGRQDKTIYIHASKTRLIEIYNDLANGHSLCGRGYKK